MESSYDENNGVGIITNKDENDALTGQIEKKTTTDMKTTSNENKIDENIEISYIDQKEDKEPELAKSDIISDQPKGNFLIWQYLIILEEENLNTPQAKEEDPNKLELQIP